MSDSEDEAVQQWRITRNDTTITALYRYLRALRDETVIAETMCSYCAECNVRDQPWPIISSNNYVYLDELASILYRAGYCWFCRFLCRVVTAKMNLEEFRLVVIGDYWLKINTASGVLEDQLLLKPENPPICGYGIELEGPELRNPSPSPVGTFHPFTCFSSASPPSRRYRNLIDNRSPLDHHLGIVEWLAFCKSHHTACAAIHSGNRVRELPVRVVDVETRTLCHLPYNQSYMALSYVWGADPLSRQVINGRVNVPTLGDILRQMNLDMTVPLSLPATIEDAITVTRMLGCRYLWVDLLCIDQNDAVDKETMIELMDRIYGSAELTLCVLDGDMFSGIPTATREPQYVQCRTTTQEYGYMYLEHKFDKFQTLSSSRWASRAWTFQEGELSTRRLCFSDEVIFLVCKEEIFHHSLRFDNSNSRIKGTLDVGGFQYLPLSFDLDMSSWNFEHYAKMTYSYTSRSITVASDAYKALHGALRRISKNLGVDFDAALPRHDIHNALLWQSRAHWGTFGAKDDASATYRRRVDFPSWSWIGWDGPAQYDCWLQNPTPSQLKLEEIYSLAVIDDNSAIMFNAVKVRKSARINLLAPVGGTTFPVLSISSQVATFDVTHHNQEREEWRLLDAEGKTIDEGSAFAEYHGTFVTSGLCAFHLYQEASRKLLSSGTQRLEFVLIQEWSALAAAIPPAPLHRHSEPEYMRQSNIDFEDTVWVMAVQRQDDGHAQRVAVLCMPSRAWYAAHPSPCTIALV